jgi:hypothetical protein
MDGTFEPHHFPLYHQFLMDIRSFPASLILTEKANLSVRIPTGMTDPSPQIKYLARHGKARTPRLLILEGKDFFAEFRRKPFICIKGKNPGIGSLAVSEVLLVGKIGPFSLVDLFCVSPGYLQRLVTAVGIDDDDFRNRIFQTLQSRLKTLLFVKGDDDG